MTRIKLQQFLCTVNAVTAFHRHGQKIPKRYLDRLANEQIDMELLLEKGSFDVDEEFERGLDQLHEMNGW